MDNIPFTTLWLNRWAELTPEYRASVMEDEDEYPKPWQIRLINQLIADMVEPVERSVEYILQLVECKLRSNAVMYYYDQEISYEYARYSKDKLPYLDKIKQLIVETLNYENDEWIKGNIVLYHAYSFGYQFIERKSCNLPRGEIERIKSLPHPEEDPDYCFRSVNYSLLSNFRPSSRGENTLWYITSNFSQTWPSDFLFDNYYPLITKTGGTLNVNVASLLKHVFSSKDLLGFLECYSIPLTEMTNHVYNAKPAGKPSTKMDDGSWDYLDNLQARLFNYDNLNPTTFNPN
jgi:hypothetical protein